MLKALLKGMLSGAVMALLAMSVAFLFFKSMGWLYDFSKVHHLNLFLSFGLLYILIMSILFGLLNITK